MLLRRRMFKKGNIVYAFDINTWTPYRSASQTIEYTDNSGTWTNYMKKPATENYNLIAPVYTLSGTSSMRRDVFGLAPDAYNINSISTTLNFDKVKWIHWVGYSYWENGVGRSGATTKITIGSTTIYNAIDYLSAGQIVDWNSNFDGNKKDRYFDVSSITGNQVLKIESNKDGSTDGSRVFILWSTFELLKHKKST